MKNNSNADYRYYYSYDVLGIKVLEPFVYEETVEVAEGVLLDFDETHKACSLEILDASKRLQVPKSSLRKIENFRISISVSEKSISLSCMFKVNVHNNEVYPSFESITSNYSNIPTMETEFATV